jgi:hypothetical protein
VRSIDRRGYRQTVVLEDLQQTAQFVVELEMYERQPVLRHRVRFQNLRPVTVRVRAADMAPWTFDDAQSSYTAFRVNQWVYYGKLGNFEPLESVVDPDGNPVTVESGAHAQHCGWLAVRDVKNRGLFTGWEFDGRATASVRHLSNEGTVQLSAAILNLSRPVAPNAQFQAPAAFLGVFQGDWDDAGYRAQRFSELAIAKPPPDGDFPYVMWDSWKYQTHIDENTLRRNAEIAARIGIELLVIDLGWSREIGDWRADPVKFPSGLRALSDYVHSLGMKFGLHFALAEAAPTSPVLRGNPDWRSTESYGYFNADSLCLSHAPVKRWLIEETTRMIDEYNVDWILQDGENMVKRCIKRTHTHDPEDSNFSNAVDGLNAVIAEVQSRRPHVHWENCEDGGNMMTYNMVRNYVTSIAADDSGPLTTRQAVYGITYPFPPRYSDRYMPEEELSAYATRSYMFGGPWIFMNRLASMREEDLAFAASEIELFKRLRGHIREGKVYHLTPRPAADRIDAIESHHEAADTGIVFVFRAESQARSQRLQVRGFNPEKLYRVRFQQDRRIFRLTGAQLYRPGLLVQMPAMWSSEIVYIEPVGEPEQ